MNTRNTSLRNTLFSSIGIYTEYFLGMLASILIARYMGPSDYGVYGLVIWLSGLGVALSNAGVASATIKFVAELRGSQQPQLLRPLLRHLRIIQHSAMTLILIVGALVFYFAGHALAPELDRPVFLLLLVAIALRAPYMLNIAVAKGFEDFRATATIAAIAAPLNLLMVLAAFVMKVSIQGFVLVYAMSGLAFYLVSRWQIRGLLPPPAASHSGPLPGLLSSRLHAYLSIVAVSMVVMFFSSSEVEVLFLNLWASAADAGNFRVAYQLASSATLLVPGVVAAVLLPMMARSLGESTDKARERFLAYTSYLLILAAPLAAFGAALAPQVVLLLFGANYGPAGTVLAWCLGTCAFVSAGAGASSLLLSADRQGSLLLLAVACGVLKVSVGALLAARFGLHGAIVAFMLVGALNLGGTVWLAVRVCQARLPWSHYLRIIAAGAVSTLPALAAAHWLPLLPALLLGGIGLVLVYAAATLLLRCWNASDLEYMHELLLRLGDHAGLLRRIVLWAKEHTDAGAQR